MTKTDANGIVQLGYARVSTNNQTLEAQLAALKEVGCSEIFQDFAVSGKNNQTSVEFKKLMKRAKSLKADGYEVTIFVTKLDRFSRSLSSLLLEVDNLAKHGIGFNAIGDGLVYDPKSPMSKFMLQMLGAFAEFERSIIRQRMEDGLAAKRERGYVGGKPPRFRAAAVKSIREEHKRGKTVGELAKDWGAGRSTIQRVLGIHGFNEPYLTVEEWERSRDESKLK